MKSVYFFLIGLSVPLLTKAQIQVRPLPSSGFEKRISAFIDNMTVVDTHEHLMSKSALKQRTTLDFMVLLQHYSACDLQSAGSPSLSTLREDTILSIKEKWEILKPFWENSKNTAYNRASLLAADKLFGIDDINETTVKLLSERINEAYQTNWINYVIEEKCKIDFLIQDSEDRSFGTDGFRYVKRLDHFIHIHSKEHIQSIGKEGNISIETLDDLVRALEEALEKAKAEGIVGIKTALAYDRILRFENTSKEDAEKVFKKLMHSPDRTYFSFEEVKPFQDYMMHRLLDLARESQLPVQIHTGLHLNENIIENSKPTHLVNLFFEYPDINFILFHGSYPYGGELSTLAKNFRNVYIDLCWLYVISPSYSERYLNEWLETVPASKIMGFGGDYLNVENTYAHLLLAKQVVTKVLTDKVRSGYFSESEAIEIAQLILHDNAVNLFHLSKQL
jgi:predicted TIM-barrel fold metal-dependent hydrolase